MLRFVAYADAVKRKFGERLALARTAKNWSQDRLADELSAALEDGQVTQGAVSQWEKGRTTPRRDKVSTIEEVLGLEHGELSQIFDGPRRPPSQLDFNSKIARLSPEDQKYVDDLVERLLRERG